LGRLFFDLNVGVTSYHFESGIPLASATQLRVDFLAAQDDHVILSGYIPGKAVGNVPAISGIGLGIMLLFLVAVGG